MINVHPLIVHFPIALLTVYCFLEILRFRVLTSKSYFFYLKATFVILGTVGAYFALLSGKIAEELVSEDVSFIVKVHELWAILTVLIFSILAFSYFILWIEKDFNEVFLNKIPFRSTVTKLAKLISSTWLIIIISIFGFIALLITGALGAVVVYGSNFDPFTKFISNLFFPH